jgi:putative membrane protein insertion efficiency factor
MPLKSLTLLDKLLTSITIWVIHVYRLTLSPDHGLMKVFFPHGACKFHPTCSQYGIDALKKYGFVRGLPKMLGRIGRCHPWSDGGNDPLR